MKVVAKCRPMLEDENQKGAKPIVKVSSDRIALDAAGKVLSLKACLDISLVLLCLIKS